MTGHYYLRNIDTFYNNFASSPFSEPDDKVDTIEIKENSITYIGHWTFEQQKRQGIDWAFEVEYPSNLLLSFKESHPWVTGYELAIAATQDKRIVLAWE